MFARTRGVLLAAILTIGAASPLAAQKVAFVNSARILQEMPQRAAAEAQIRTALEGLAARQQVMVDSLNGMLAAFERDSASLAQADKLTRFQAMQAYDARYRDTLEVLERESQEAQAAAMQPMFDLIRTALDDLRAAENITMILDLSREGSQVVSFDRNLDISDRVLTRIRATAGARPGAAPTTPRPPAAAPAPATQRPAQPGPVAQPSGVRRP
jgi:outer membrane protein